MVLAGPAEQGNVQLARATWNLAFLDECEEFPLGTHDDQVDAVSSAVNWLRGLAGGGLAAKAAPAGDTSPSHWAAGSGRRTLDRHMPTFSPASATDQPIGAGPLPATPEPEYATSRPYGS